MAQAQGSLAKIIMQIQSAANALPTNVKSKQLYYASESLQFSRAEEQSDIQRGGVRHPTESTPGATDVAGDITTELQATSPLLYAACGSMETTMAGGTMGTAMTTPSAVIDAVNQTMTITATSHGCAVGDSVEILGLTAPTALNGKIFPVIGVTSTSIFVIRIQMGVSTTFTLGTGTIKRVTAGGVCTHTIKGGGKLPYYLIEKGFTDINQYIRELGCICGKLSFGIAAAGKIGLSSSWMGCSETTATTSFDTGTPLDNGKRVFSNNGIAAANIKEGGTAIANVKSIDNITIDNDLDGDTFVVGGGGTRLAINPGVYKVSGSVMAMFEDMTLYNKAKNSTESSLDFTLTRGTGAGTDNNESLQVVIPELKYNPKSPVISGPKGVLVELGFSAYYDNAADATAMKFVVINSVLPGAMI